LCSQFQPVLTPMTSCMTSCPSSPRDWNRSAWTVCGAVFSLAIRCSQYSTTDASILELTKCGSCRRFRTSPGLRVRLPPNEARQITSRDGLPRFGLICYLALSSQCARFFACEKNASFWSCSNCHWKHATGGAMAAQHRFDLNRERPASTSPLHVSMRMYGRLLMASTATNHHFRDGVDRI
jgi:hypothetical protein